MLELRYNKRRFRDRQLKSSVEQAQTNSIRQSIKNTSLQYFTVRLSASTGSMLSGV
jgi:hypothetical protein